MPPLKEHFSMIWTSIDNTLATILETILEKLREALKQRVFSQAFLLLPPNPTIMERVRPL